MEVSADRDLGSPRRTTLHYQAEVRGRRTGCEATRGTHHCGAVSPIIVVLVSRPARTDGTSVIRDAGATPALRLRDRT